MTSWFEDFRKKYLYANYGYCDCKKDPKEAYKDGEDLLTDDFARACKTCGSIITPDEFTDIIEEHDYAN